MYHAASSSPSHTAQLLLHSSNCRVQHSVVESVVYCTTSSSSSCSTRHQRERFRQRETGGVPGRGGGVIGEKNITGATNSHGRKRGTFLGTFWCTLPEGRPITERPTTERPRWKPTTGRPGWMGSTRWCRTRGSRTGKSCRSGMRVQSGVPSFPTVTLWNRKTMGSTNSPKRSTTEL